MILMKSVKKSKSFQKWQTDADLVVFIFKQRRKN